MSASTVTASDSQTGFIWWRWVNVVVASALMLATLPGRTQGLGLITEPLLADLQIDRVSFANINLWATLLGATFCFPAGFLIDRYGLRFVSSGIVLLLAGAVWAMSAFHGGVIGLFALLFLARALGQSALSVASITTVGKSFGRQDGLPMGVFSFLLSAFFIVAFIVVGGIVSERGWRTAWLSISVFLALGVAPLALLLLREDWRGSLGRNSTIPSLELNQNSSIDFTLGQALRTGAFWIFGASTALFALVSSGFGLFNEAILLERGFDQKTFHTFLAVTTFVGLIGQIVCGWLSNRMPLRHLLGVAMLLYAIALVVLPWVRGPFGLWTVALLIGLTGGFITVLFFAIWSHAFGREHLGRIQGAAQLLTVLASAAGPLLFAGCYSAMGSYAPLLLLLSAVVFGLSMTAWKVSLPKRALPHSARMASMFR